MAETCVFVKQSVEPLRCDPLFRGCPFSRSYGTFLPSSLTRVLPFACVFSTRLPVSVWGTVGLLQRVGVFSRPAGSATSSLAGRRHLLSEACHRLSTRRLAYPQSLALPPLPGTGLLTGCPSSALSSLDLGPTNPTRTDLPSEPLDSRRTRFSHVFATHASILTPHHSNPPSGEPSPLWGRSPTWIAPVRLRCSV